MGKEELFSKSYKTNMKIRASIVLIIHCGYREWYFVYLHRVLSHISDIYISFVHYL